jgi:uncharacterized Zn-binding protein involved in type VI secretion
MSVFIAGHKVALISQSSAGGGLIEGGAVSVTVDNKKVALNGDLVAVHGIESHVNAHIIATSNQTVTINGKLIVVDTDLASCEHELITE